MLLILLAVVAMLVGPVLYLRVRKTPGWAQRLESGLITVLLVLVAFVLLPEVYQRSGLAGLLLVLLGMALPALLEHYLHRLAHTTHLITLLIATSGLMLHSMFDGAALSPVVMSVEINPVAFAAAVLVHRLLAGMVIWLILQPLAGKGLALWAILLVSLAAVPGYFLAERLLPLLAGEGPALFQALVVGTIIHGLMHRSHRHSHGYY